MEVVAEAIWESEQVASAVSLLIMAIAGAVTLYASSHWSATKREERKRLKDTPEDDERDS
jgi:uncharacterized protein (DUF2062 family)